MTYSRIKQVPRVLRQTSSGTESFPGIRVILARVCEIFGVFCTRLFRTILLVLVTYQSVKTDLIFALFSDFCLRQQLIIYLLQLYLQLLNLEAQSRVIQKSRRFDVLVADTANSSVLDASHLTS